MKTKKVEVSVAMKSSWFTIEVPCGADGVIDDDDIKDYLEDNFDEFSDTLEIEDFDYQI